MLAAYIFGWPSQHVSHAASVPEALIQDGDNAHKESVTRPFNSIFILFISYKTDILNNAANSCFKNTLFSTSKDLILYSRAMTQFFEVTLHLFYTGQPMTDTLSPC